MEDKDVIMEDKDVSNKRRMVLDIDKSFYDNISFISKDSSFKGEIGATVIKLLKHLIFDAPDTEIEVSPYNKISIKALIENGKQKFTFKKGFFSSIPDKKIKPSFLNNFNSINNDDLKKELYFFIENYCQYLFEDSFKRYKGQWFYPTLGSSLNISIYQAVLKKDDPLKNDLYHALYIEVNRKDNKVMLSKLMQGKLLRFQAPDSLGLDSWDKVLNCLELTQTKDTNAIIVGIDEISKLRIFFGEEVSKMKAQRG